MAGPGAVLAFGLVMLGLWLMLTARRHRRGATIGSRLASLAVLRAVNDAEPGKRWLERVLPAPLHVLTARAALLLPRGLLVGLAVAPIVACAAAFRWGGTVGGVVCCVVLIGLELALLRHIARRRLRRFTADLPGFLEKIIQFVKVGSSLHQALLRAVELSPPAFKTYLAPVVRRTENGAPVDEALRWLAARLQVTGFHMFVLSVEANLRYGGQLATTLGFLVQVLRDHQRVEREMRAATGESRATAWVIGSLPIAVALAVWLRSPGYLAFFTSSQGHFWLGLAIAFETVGMVLLNRMMRLEP